MTTITLLTCMISPSIPAIHHALPSGVMCMSIGWVGISESLRSGNALMSPLSSNDSVHLLSFQAREVGNISGMYRQEYRAGMVAMPAIIDYSDILI